MTENQERKIEINVHDGGQANIALDNGNIDATQCNMNKKIFQSNIITYGQNITYTNNFVGRENEINEILEKLEDSNRLLIRGMGGIGKTTILKKLYHTMVERYKNTNKKFGYFEYELSMDDTIYNALEFEKIGDRNIDVQKAKRVLEAYANDGEIIIFIDNVPIEKYNELQQLDSIKGKIVITSRQNEYENYETVFIDKMSVEECKEIFKKESGILGDSQDLDYIINTLIGRHTLTIKLLAKIAKKKQWGINILKNKLLDVGFKIEYIDSGKMTNILIEYKKLYSISELNIHEQNILEGFSLLREAKLDKDKYQKFLALDAEDLENDELYELYEKGWLEKEGDKFSIHPVFAEFISETREIGISNHLELYEVIKLLCSSLDDSDMLKKQNYLTEIISFGKNAPIKWDVEREIYNIAYIAKFFAEYNSAIILLHRIEKKQEELFIKAQLLLSEVYLNISDFQKAKERLDRIKEIWFDEVVKKELLYLYIEYKINCSLYLEKSNKNLDKEKAINELEEIMELEMEELTQARIYNCLGGFYTNLNLSTENLNKALEYHEKARWIRENNKDNLGLAKTYNNIGNVYFYMSLCENKNEDNLKKAEEYYRMSLDLRQKLLNSNHPDIARVLVHLGNVCVNRGKYEEALLLMQKGLRIRKKSLGDCALEVGMTYFNMAQAYRGLLDEKNMLQCVKNAKKIYLLLYGKDSDKYRDMCEKCKKIIKDI